MNQYQANHNASPKSAGAKGLLDFLRVVLLIALVGLALWFFS